MVHPEEYKSQYLAVESQLREARVAVEAVDSAPALEERLRRGGVDIVVFFTRGLFDDALQIRRRFGIRTCVLTGWDADLPHDEVTLIWKGGGDQRWLVNRILDEEIS